MKPEKGQIILILILVMTVALSIGLSIVQKSLVDVSTASKVEQSSRAFSAAEAGIEQVLTENGPIGIGSTSSVNFSENQSKAQVSNLTLIPAVPAAGSQQEALEFPPLAKEDVAQVWLADYTSTSNPPTAGYAQNTLDVYWGTPGITDLANKPAIEVKVVYYTSGIYQTQPFYLDSNSSRITSNGFTDASLSCPSSGYSITTTSGSNRQFFCKSTLTGLNTTLMLMRIRLLYSSTSQPFAVQALGICGVPCSLPSQARSIISTGVSGETQRKVKVFQEYKMVPPYFDYAIFSTGEIKK